MWCDDVNASTERPQRTTLPLVASLIWCQSYHQSMDQSPSAGTAWEMQSAFWPSNPDLSGRGETPLCRAHENLCFMSWRGASLLSTYGCGLNLAEQVSGSFPTDVSKHKSNKLFHRR